MREVSSSDVSVGMLILFHYFDFIIFTHDEVCFQHLLVFNNFWSIEWKIVNKEIIRFLPALDLIVIVVLISYYTSLCYSTNQRFNTTNTKPLYWRRHLASTLFLPASRPVPNDLFGCYPHFRFENGIFQRIPVKILNLVLELVQYTYI